MKVTLLGDESKRQAKLSKKIGIPVTKIAALCTRRSDKNTGFLPGRVR